VVVLVDGLPIEDKKSICLVLGCLWENLHGHQLLGKCFCFEGWLYFHLCVQIHLLGGRPVKVDFWMLASLPNKFLWFQGPNWDWKSVKFDQCFDNSETLLLQVQNLDQIIIVVNNWPNDLCLNYTQMRT